MSYSHLHDFPEFRPGPLSIEAAEHLNRLAYELTRILNINAEPPLELLPHSDSYTVRINQDAPPIFAKLTCVSISPANGLANWYNGQPTAYYGFVEQDFATNGKWVDKLGGLIGSPTIGPAFEKNNELNIPIGTIVQLWPAFLNSGTQGQEYVFDARENPVPAIILADSGGGATTLNGAIDNAVTSLTVVNYAGFPLYAPFFIQIEGEILKVTAGQGTNTWTVVRGQQNTGPAAHADTTAVAQVRPGYAWQEVSRTGADFRGHAQGQWQTVTGGRSGTLGVNPAFERNGNFQVPTGTYILLWRGFNDQGQQAPATTTTINQSPSIGATDQTVIVAGTAGFPIGALPFYIQIDSETLLVTAVATPSGGGANTQWTIVRNVLPCGTAAAHSNGATVKLQTSHYQEWVFDYCCTPSSGSSELTYYETRNVTSANRNVNNFNLSAAAGFCPRKWSIKALSSTVASLLLGGWIKCDTNQKLEICNSKDSQIPIVPINRSSGSSASNQYGAPDNYNRQIKPGECKTFKYDENVGMWMSSDYDSNKGPIPPGPYTSPGPCPCVNNSNASSSATNYNHDSTNNQTIFRNPGGGASDNLPTGGSVPTGYQRDVVNTSTTNSLPTNTQGGDQFTNGQSATQHTIPPGQSVRFVYQGGGFWGISSGGGSTYGYDGTQTVVTAASCNGSSLSVTTATNTYKKGNLQSVA